MTAPIPASSPGPGQHGSYVLISQAADNGDDEQQQQQQPSALAESAAAFASPPPPPPSRPRFFALLPLLALADISTAVALAVLVVHRLDGIPTDGQAQLAAVLKTKRLIGTVIAGAAGRTGCLSFIGCSKRIRHRVIAVAATCLTSVLLLVAVANILFLMPPLAPPTTTTSSYLDLPRLPLPKLPKATAALLVGHQLALTLLEWATYIAVVGVRVAPRRVGAVNARRWQHAVTSEAQGWRGEDESLYDVDEGEAYSDEDDEPQAQPGTEAAELGDASGVASTQHDADLLLLQNEAHSPLLRPTVPSQSAVPPLSPASPATRAAASQSRLRTLSAHATPEGVHVSPSLHRFQHSPRASLYGAVDMESQSFPTREQSDDDLDPDDIVDIDPQNRRLARQESRRRLDAAKQRGDLERERRTSTGVGLGMLGRSPSSVSDFGGRSRTSLVHVPSRVSREEAHAPSAVPPRNSSTHVSSAASSSHTHTSAASTTGSSFGDASTSRKGAKIRRPAWLGGKKRRGRDSEDGPEA